LKLLLMLLLLLLLQVWFTASTSPAGRSGSVRSSIKSNAGPAAGKLRIAALIIAGVPTQLKDPKPTANLGALRVGAGSENSSKMEELTVVYDAAVGTLKISGADLPAGEPLNLTWSL
jgi:hypothetical protein